MVQKLFTRDGRELSVLTDRDEESARATDVRKVGCIWGMEVPLYGFSSICVRLNNAIICIQRCLQSNTAVC